MAPQPPRVPRSAHHGLRWYEVDVSALVIRALAAIGLAREVVTADAEAQRARLSARLVDPAGHPAKT